ncbi:MAG: DUF4293 domain-containing protein [Prosthecochloris sp.]|nr:DUF4293 domain-containing protein [Prosthecochloris sp.]
MLARIQTLYLILAAILAFASSFLPFWYFQTETTLVLADFSPLAEAGLVHITTLYISSILSPLSGITALVAIALFTNRKLQSLLLTSLMVIFVADILSGLTAAHYLNVWIENSSAMAAEHGPGGGLFVMLPLPLLYWLAMKGIKKDEKIATAYKRL